MVERLRARETRVHVSIGPTCNNNCLFCMEEDRDWRYQSNSGMTSERVRWILEAHRGAEEVCFTSGEPTLRPELPRFASWARELGYPRVSVMTNARRLSYPPYAGALAKAGMNRFYVSIHGHEKKLHEGLTRTPGSFEQTVAGIDSVARLKPLGIDLHSSTVLTGRNLPHLVELFRFLVAHGVDQVVVNVMQVNGRADTYFDQIFPTYTDTAAAFREFLERVDGERPNVFLVDIPLCTTESIPDFHRGYIEKHLHYERGLDEAQLGAGSELLEGFDQRPREGEGVMKGLVRLERADLDLARRVKRDACRGCRYDAVCEGVWANYVRRRGWDEMAPVPAESPQPPGSAAAQ